jgi:hypothetical protein
MAGNTGALLKEVYGGMSNPIAPEGSFAKDIEFVPPKERTGRDYYFPVRLGLEQGAKYSVSYDAFELQTPVDGVYEDATLAGAEIAMKASLSYGEMSRLSASKGESSKAYDQGVAIKILNLTQGMELHREMALWYGPGANALAAPLANIGVVNSVGAAAGANGIRIFTITRASFIPGFWQDAQNILLEFVASGGLTPFTLTAAKVIAVDIKNARITVQGLQAEVNNVGFAAGATVHVYSSVGNSMIGAQPICENTGIMFGIDGAQYPQWKAQSYPVNGTLSFDKLIEGITLAADSGLDGGCTCYVNNRSWSTLLTDEVAMRRYLGSDMGGKAKPGFREIEFITNCGVIKIKPYRYMKQSLAFAIPTDEWKRVGSSDITATLPGNPDEFFYQQLDNAAGAQLRMYMDQSIVSEIPFHSVIFSAIDNPNDSIPSLT